MRFGMPWWIGSGDPVQGVKAAADNGFDFLEVSLDEPWPTSLDAEALKAAASDHSIALGFHAPWRDQAMAHPRPVVADAAAAVIKVCARFAIDAGAEYMVFHVDAHHFARYPVPEVVEAGIKRAHETFRGLGFFTEGSGLELLVENTSNPMATPDQLGAFLERSANTGFCFDQGHAEMAVGNDVPGATSDPVAWATMAGDRYRLLHLMDYVLDDGKVLDHLVPGAGSVDTAAVVASAKAAGVERVLIEAFFADTKRTEASVADLAASLVRVKKG